MKGSEGHLKSALVLYIQTHVLVNIQQNILKIREGGRQPCPYGQPPLKAQSRPCMLTSKHEKYSCGSEIEGGSNVAKEKYEKSMTNLKIVQGQRDGITAAHKIATARCSFGCNWVGCNKTN
eukprot:410271-Pelagomonas_calceolata.AAC.2